LLKKIYKMGNLEGSGVSVLYIGRTVSWRLNWSVWGVSRAGIHSCVWGEIYPSLAPESSSLRRTREPDSYVCGHLYTCYLVLASLYQLRWHQKAHVLNITKLIPQVLEQQTTTHYYEVVSPIVWFSSAILQLSVLTVKAELFAHTMSTADWFTIVNSLALNLPKYCFAVPINTFRPHGVYILRGLSCQPSGRSIHTPRPLMPAIWMEYIYSAATPASHLDGVYRLHGLSCQPSGRSIYTARPLMPAIWTEY
jgi:hypothetical protein